MKSRKVQLFSVIDKLFVIAKQYRISADYHGFAFLVFMVSFVLKMALAIDLYLLKLVRPAKDGVASRWKPGLERHEPCHQQQTLCGQW